MRRHDMKNRMIAYNMHCRETVQNERGIICNQWVAGSTPVTSSRESPRNDASYGGFSRGRGAGIPV